MNIIPQVSPRALSKQTILQKAGNTVGKVIPNAISNKFEMNRIGSLGRYSLLSVALVFVLGVRYFKSRDAHEKREVLTRDGVTVVSAMVAVPIVKNWMQRGLDKISKIPTATETAKKFSIDDFGFDNLKNWYSKANLMQEKVLTMARNIVERKGDLAKAFSTLGDEGMKHVKTMLKGKEATSENILKALEQAFALENKKSILQRIKNAFSAKNKNVINAFEGLTSILSKEDNNLVKAAQRLKAIPNFASLVFVTGLLGWGIPAFNIRFTRKKLKQTLNGANNVTVLEPKLNPSQKNVVNLFFAQNIQSKEK